MTVPIASEVQPAQVPAKPRKGVWRRLLQRKLAVLGLIIIFITVAGAIFAPWLTPYHPDEQLFDGLTLEGAPLPPSANFWLGTDLLGRDLATRILYGARTSLIIGIGALPGAQGNCWSKPRSTSKKTKSAPKASAGNSGQQSVTSSPMAVS